MTTTVRRHALTCIIDGIPTPAYEANGSFGVDARTGTGSVSIPAPLAAHIDLNQRVEVQGGYRDGVIRTRLSGRVTDITLEVSRSGRTATIDVEGWSSLLDWKQETDLVFAGPISLYEIVRSLCRWRGVPSYQIDTITAPDGVTPIVLGGVPDHNDGNETIPRRTSPLAWLRRVLGLFGYRIFDTPDGTVRVQRINGAPGGTPAATYATGQNLYRLRRARTARTMATYITVEGPRYTDSDGVTVVPRSIAEAVPESTYLIPPGYRAGDIKDDVLVTEELAAIVRNVAEIDGGAPTVNERWECRGDALRAPGEVVTVDSPHLGTSGTYWLMRLDWRIDSRGYIDAMEGWAGGGEPLPAGIDHEEISVFTSPRHVGDEYVAWYAVPSPQGKSLTFSITVPETYTSISYECYLHGSNSQFIGGTSEDLTVSKIEVYQDQGQDDPDKPVGSADMPVVPEYYERRLPYGSGLTHWQFSRGPIPGRLEPGPATVKLTSGENKKLAAGVRFDDWEIQQLKLVLRGVGTPVLPTTTEVS